MIDLDKEPTWFKNILRNILNEKRQSELASGLCNVRREGEEEKDWSPVSRDGFGGHVSVSLWSSNTEGNGGIYSSGDCKVLWS